MLERLEFIIDAVSGGAVRDLEKVGATAVATGAELDVMGNQAGAAGLKTRLLGAEGQNAGLLLKGGMLLAGAAVVKFGLDAVQKFAEATGEVRKFRNVVGGTAEDSSRIVFAMDELGIGVDKASISFGRLERDIGHNKDKLSEYGVQVAQTKDGNTDMSATLLSISDAYNKTEDPAKRAALVFDAFGKSGQALVPMLKQGRDGLKELYDEAAKTHHIFSDDDLAKGLQYNLAMNQLKATFQGLALSAGQILIPAVTEVASGISSVVQGVDAATGPIGGMGNAMKYAFDATPIGMVSHAAGAFGDLMSGDFEGALENSIRTVPILGDAVGDLGNALGLGGDEATTYKDKQDALAEAQKRVADLIADGKRGTPEYAAAMRDARAASGELAGQTDQLKTALQTKSEAALSATNAILGMASADLAAQGSALGVQSAQLAYNKTLTDGTSSVQQQQQAQLALEQSVISATNAAGAKAVADLGPHATASEKARAAASAERDAFNFLAGTLDGPTRAALQGYLDKVNAVPPTKNTTVTADTSQAMWALSSLHTALAGIQDKSIYFAPKAPGAATGGPRPGGWTGWVGEEGPEIITLPSAGYVYTAAESAAMTVGSGRSAASASGDGSPNVTVMLAVKVDPITGAVMVDQIQQFEEANGPALIAGNA